MQFEQPDLFTLLIELVVDSGMLYGHPRAALSDGVLELRPGYLTVRLALILETEEAKDPCNERHYMGRSCEIALHQDCSFDYAKVGEGSLD